MRAVLWGNYRTSYPEMVAASTLRGLYAGRAASGNMVGTMVRQSPGSVPRLDRAASQCPECFRLAQTVREAWAAVESAIAAQPDARMAFEQLEAIEQRAKDRRDRVLRQTHDHELETGHRVAL